MHISLWTFNQIVMFSISKSYLFTHLIDDVTVFIWWVQILGWLWEALETLIFPQMAQDQNATQTTSTKMALFLVCWSSWHCVAAAFEEEMQRWTNHKKKQQQAHQGQLTLMPFANVRDMFIQGVFFNWYPPKKLKYGTLCIEIWEVWALVQWKYTNMRYIIFIHGFYIYMYYTIESLSWRTRNLRFFPSARRTRTRSPFPLSISNFQKSGTDSQLQHPF